MGDIGKEINSTFPSEQVKALINIKYTANWLDQRANKVLKPYKISAQQYNILRILRGAKQQITVQTVRDRMVEKSPNTTRLMDKLCEKKLIDRTRCESDRRLVFVEIAQPGLALLDSIVLDDTQKLLSNLSEEELIQLNSLLDKIR